MKKFLSLILAFLLVVSVVPMGVFTLTASAATSGYYTYTVSNGEAIITDVNTSIRGGITIPSTLGGYPVTCIDGWAFSYCDSLTSITIPDGVTSIGYAAFEYCYSLTSITIPDSVTSIDGYAFYNCDSLTNIVIPDSVLGIGEDAFENCDSLKSVTIGNGVTSIGNYAFYNCYNLTSITIPDTVIKIGYNAFNGCSRLTSITIPNGVTSIGSDAFYGCSSLTSITIPNSVTSISEGVFFGCFSLVNITIPDSVKSIGSYAFYDCDSLESVTIGNSVISIGDYAFSDCDSLTSITIPDSVTSIESGAFEDCRSLKNVFFTGSKEDRIKISIDDLNDELLNATWHYNSDIDADDFLPGKIINVNTTNLSGNDIVITPKISYDDKNKLFKNASGVELQKTFTGGTLEPVNGSFVLDGNADMNFSAVLVKEGYRKYIIPQGVLNSWKKIDLGNLLTSVTSEPAFSHSAFLLKDRKDGKPYISTVFCQESSGVQNDINHAYKEIQTETVNVHEGSKYNIVISADGLNGKSCTYYIAQDQQRKISSKTGVFNAVDLFSVIDFQKDTYAYLVTEDNVVSELMHINLKKIAKTDIEETIDFLKSSKICLLGENTAKVEFSDGILFEGAEISLDAFKIPIGYEFDGDTLRVSVGVNIFNANTELKKNSPTKYKKWVIEFFKDYKDSVKDITELMTDNLNIDTNKKTSESFLEKWGLVDEYNKKEKNWDVDILGYAEYEVVDGWLIEKESSISIEGSFSFEHTIQGTILAIVPAYFSLEAGCSVGAIGNMSRVIADDSIPFEFDLTIKIEPELELGAGLGYKKAFSAGAYAEATMPITFELGKRHLLIKAKGEIGLTAKIFVYEEKLKILEGELNLVDKYWGSTKKLFASRPSANSGLETEIEYSLQDRDYLENTSGWLSGARKRYLKSGLQGSGLTLTNLQTSVYDNAMPKVVTFGDKMLMTWIEDCADRDAYNRMRLMYSVYDGAVWSQPQPVCDDGFNDNEPIIMTDGKDVYFAWQKLCKSLSEDDLENVGDTLNYVEIYSAKYDAESQTICNIRKETENDNYEYLQHISIIDGKPQLFYVGNNDLTTLNNNTIHQSDFNGNNVALLDNLNYILDISTTECDGEISTSYILDVDGNIATTNDIRIYTYKPSTQTYIDETAKIIEFENESYQVFIKDIFYADFGGKNTLFAVGSKEIYQINADGVSALYVPSNLISGDANYIQKNGIPMLLWTSNTDCGNAVYCSSFENGEWTQPISISETNTLLSNVTIVNYGEDIKGVCTSTDLIYNEETEKYDVGQTNLCAFDINEKYDIEVNTINIEEENIHIGEKTSFSVYVKNNGSEFVEKVTFNVSDGLGYSQTGELTVNLNPGEEKRIELEYTAPDNYGKTDLTVTAELSEFEPNKDNNVVSKEIGLPKIVVSDATVYKTNSSYIVSAFVTNESDVSANNIEIVSRFNDDAILSSTVIESIPPRGTCYIDFEILSSKVDFEENVAKVFLTSENKNVQGNTTTVLISQNTTDCLHPVSYESIESATCTQEGKRFTICAGCNEILEEEIISDALGHTYDNDYDADCNLCGELREVPEKVVIGDIEIEMMPGDELPLDDRIDTKYILGWKNLDGTKYEGTTYAPGLVAEFVETKMMTVKYQLGRDGNSIRYIASIDETERYNSVGWVFSITNENPEIGGANVTDKNDKKVYSGIIASGQVIDAAAIYGGADYSKYLYVLEITDILEADADIPIYVRPYVEMNDGRIVYGDVSMQTLNGLKARSK